MAISLKDIYAYITGSTSAYPWGSFKNATGADTLDGTPFEKQWADDIYGFLQALLTTAGLTPSGAPDTALNSQYLQAIIAIGQPVGKTEWSPVWTTPPPGYLELNGGTIGDADSVATARANADSVALFTLMWPLTALPIYSAAGAVVARGADAATDFAAHRKIALPDMRGRIPRGWDHGANVDVGRLLGSYQADSFASHSHGSQYDDRTPTGIDGGGARSEIAGVGTVWNYPTTLAGGTETVPKNIAGMFVIKY